MKSNQGYFIVLEGTDGSGKTTQFKLLVNSLRRLGYKVATVDFPQYGKPSAYFVEQYLNGRYGSADKVGPYRASFFYALDRFQATKEIKKRLGQGKIVLSNRFTLSNAGHQGGKINNLSERKKYWQWLFNLEYKILGIPKPDLNILVHMPAAVAQKLVDKKTPRAYIRGKKRDVHEADLKHLKQAEQSFLQVSKMFKVPVVECYQQQKPLTPKEIHNKVFIIVKKQLKK